DKNKEFVGSYSVTLKGESMPLDCHLIPIKNDLFDIAERIKEIDADYYVVYNKKRGRFEIRNDKSRDGIACVLPFDRLDARATEYVMRTRRERVRELIFRMEEENNALTEKKEKRARDEANKKAEYLVGYLERGGMDIPPYDSL
ncbi:MAG: hypothetical protein LBQ27_02740, partial [Clostridiales bacterium]|nr:hypothetical protein [Clostridiales bacterium]